MNVALVVETPFPPLSRANLRLYRLGLALAGKGYGVYMVSPSFYPHSKRRGFHSDIYAVQHFGFAALLYVSFLRFFVALFHVFSATFCLIRLCRRMDVRVVHAWHPLASSSAVLAGKIVGARVFVDWTDFYSDIVRYESSLFVPVAQSIERFILRNSDRVITVSEEMGEVLVGMGAMKDKVCVVPDGVDDDMFNLKVDGSSIRRRYGLGDCPTVIFHGDVKFIDGVDVLIRAFASVLRRLPDAKLLIVGGGRGYFSMVKRLANELGIGSSVVFTGWVPHRRVPEFIEAADVGVMPLRSTLETNCYLSFKLFEYWAMGKPVVVSNVKAISKIVENGVNGILVEPENVENLAEALLMVLKDHGKTGLMGENGRRMVEETYNWNSLMEQEARIYDGFLRSGKFGNPLCRL
jgi:glycosyltransferase involved in cell wall biosynthesis